MSMSTNPTNANANAGADTEAGASPGASVPAPPESESPSQALPDWAQEMPRRRRLLSRRNALLAVGALLLIGFVVWLNFPFIPDPVILGRQPDATTASASSGASWTMAGRTLGQTRYVPDAVAEPAGRLVWSTNTGPATLAAPIVHNGRIYLGAHFRIAALDAATGAELADLPTTGPIGNSLALADDGTLYYSMPDRRLVARNADTGAIRWEYELGDSTAGPVAVANGIVYAGALDGVTYAVNAATGQRIWQHESLSELRSPPALGDGNTLFAASADRSLYALDARTGQERARFRTPAQLAAAPVAANGLVYFVSGGQVYAMKGDALEFPGRYAVTRVWSQLWLWGFPLPAPPAQPGDAWRFRPDAGRTEGIIAAPAVAEDGFYVGDLLGNLHAGDALTGEVRWIFAAEDGIVASPAVVGSLVVFGDKSGWLYGVNRDDGAERWRLRLPAGIRTDPVYAGGRLLVRTEDGALHSLE